MTTSALLSALAVVIAAGLALFGSLWALRSARKLQQEQSSVEQRKLDQSAFDQFTARYEHERAVLEVQIDRARRNMQSCLRYIITLKQTMREAGVEPPPTPDDLALIPFEGLD